MGFWSSLRRSRSKPHGNESSAPAPPGDPPEEAAHALPATVERLARLGEAGGPSDDEALSLLRAARSTPDEGLALDTLVERHRVRPLPERLLVAVASAFADRGDRASAQQLLGASHGPSGLVLRADLLADQGDLAGAVATIERALLQDLDAPGARERWLAWRKRLGLGPALVRADPATETIAAPRARTPFDLLKEIGRGSAGVVFEAKDRELGRRVALKLYHQPERDRGQLLAEARIAAALEGPGIVRVFDADPNDGWIAVERASVGALRDVLRSDASAVLPARPWVLALASALARVHAAGWVHHDVKPANILLSRALPPDPPATLDPWLADFGSARRTGEPSPPGSLGYVSPERIAGRPSDARDDVYGFGRALEDVLAATHATDEPLRRVAAACVGPDEARPRDGAALVALLHATR